MPKATSSYIRVFNYGRPFRFTAVTSISFRQACLHRLQGPARRGVAALPLALGVPAAAHTSQVGFSQRDLTQPGPGGVLGLHLPPQTTVTYAWVPSPGGVLGRSGAPPNHRHTSRNATKSAACTYDVSPRCPVVQSQSCPELRPSRLTRHAHPADLPALKRVLRPDQRCDSMRASTQSEIKPPTPQDTPSIRPHASHAAGMTGIFRGCLPPARGAGLLTMIPIALITVRQVTRLST